MRRLCLPLLAAVLSFLAPAPARAGEPLTFLVTSDSHYTNTKNPDRQGRNRATIERMNALPGTAWPASLGGGTIGQPRGVLVLGDLVDDGDRPGETAVQWRHFAGQFGLDGTDGLLKYPVFEGWGNHDGPPVGAVKHGFSVQARIKERNRQRLEKGLIGAVSANGLHYSWDWNGIHFVQTNLYPADRQHAKVRYSLPWHDPQGALTFLREDLRKCVGDSGRPVVIVAHCGFDTDWWAAEDWAALYRAVQPYNVLAYFHGHTGTGVRTWKPEGEERPLTVVNTGQTERGFFVVEIDDGRVRLAYHSKKDAKVPERPATEWEWRFPLVKKIERGKAAAGPANEEQEAGDKPASPVSGDPKRLARIRATKVPAFDKPLLFHTPEADRVLAALEVFPPDNPWNLVVSDWPLHPRSKEIVATIGPAKPLRYNPDMGFVLVPPGQPKVPVRITGYPDESDRGPFPVPDTLPIEGWPVHYQREGKKLTLDQVQRLREEGDRHALVVDPVNRKLYEFYQARRTDAGWEATQTSVFDLASNRLRPDGWTSADAAGLPIFPAVVRYDELQRGEIEHALRVTVTRTRRAYVYPATHFASRLTDERLPRMGERLRLRRDFDESKFSPEVQVILRALKKYGMFVADNGIDWAVSVAPDPRIPVLHEELRKVKGSDFEVVTPPAGWRPPR